MTQAPDKRWRSARWRSARRRERLWQDIGIVVWASFLAACVETMTFFAYFDPAMLGLHEIPSAWVANRLAGYSVGFFIFWGFTLCAALLTAYLINSHPRRSRTRADREAR